MAQFTIHGRLKLLFNGDNLPMSAELKDQLQCKLVGNSIKVQKQRIRFSGGRTGVFSPSSSKLSKFGAKSRMTVSDGGILELEEEEDYDSESEEDELYDFKGLVLDFSYRPIHVVCWQRAICLEFREKADVLEYYDQTVNSPNGSYNIPAVLRVQDVVQVVKRRRIRHLLNRKSILHRDNYSCQYCYSDDNLTIDHLVPASRGGEDSWNNLVTACAECNLKKGHRTPEEAKMELLKVPKAPKDYDIRAIPLTERTIRSLKRNGLPDEWRPYLHPSLDIHTLNPAHSSFAV